MKNGWTGGQYSCYRAVFGLYLLIHFVQLLPWSGELFSNQGMISNSRLSPFLRLFPNILMLNDSPVSTMALTLCGLVASIFFIMGKWDRVSAFVLWYILACFLGRNPLIANPSLPFVGWLLLAHLFLPVAPYGSLRAKGRVDPGGNWRMTPSIFLTAWCVMSIAYTYSGVTKLFSPSWVDGTAFAYLLQNPLVRCNGFRAILILFPPLMLKAMTWGALTLELTFGFLALFNKLRPWIWSAMLLMHLNLLCLVNFADLTWGMIVIHLFTFDPRWIKPLPIQGKLTVFYDGTCGFCHAFVRFVLSENRARAPFRFAPIQNQSSTALNSIIVEEDGCLLDKFRAVLRVLAYLGGIWRILAWMLSLVPAKLGNGAYNCVARIRHRIFARPKGTCPVIPSEMREFFN